MMDKDKALKIAKNVFKLIVTFGALYWVFHKINFNELKNALIGCDWFFLILAVVSYSISQLIASSRLNSFFKAIHLNLSERYNFRLYQMGLLYNFFLPGGIGGDGYKIYFLKNNHNIKARKVLGAVFFDRLSGLWALAVITCLLIIFMPRLGIPNYLPLVAIVIGSASYYFCSVFFFMILQKISLLHTSRL